MPNVPPPSSSRSHGNSRKVVAVVCRVANPWGRQFPVHPKVPQSRLVHHEERERWPDTALGRPRLEAQMGGWARLQSMDQSPGVVCVCVWSGWERAVGVAGWQAARIASLPPEDRQRPLLRMIFSCPSHQCGRAKGNSAVRVGSVAGRVLQRAV